MALGSRVPSCVLNRLESIEIDNQTASTTLSTSLFRLSNQDLEIYYHAS